MVLLVLDSGFCLLHAVFHQRTQHGKIAGDSSCDAIFCWSRLISVRMKAGITLNKDVKRDPGHTYQAWSGLVVWSEKEDVNMSKLVMIIDDSLTVRKIIETSLRREGFESVSYPDGIEALRALHERRHRPRAGPHRVRPRCRR